MKNIITLSLLLSFIYSLSAQEINYPPVYYSDAQDSLFDEVIADPYRWLENLESEKTKDWVKAQKKIASKYLSKVRRKENGHSTVSRFGQVDYNLPIKVGKYYYKWAYFNPRSPAGLFIQSSMNDEPRILINPERISVKEKIDIDGGFASSKDSKYLAFSFSRNGGDGREIKVQKTSGNFTKDHLKDVRSSNVAWKGKGFFYMRNNLAALLKGNPNSEIYYHELGAKQETDQKIYGRNSKKEYFHSFSVTSDERYLIIRERNEAAGKTNIFFKDLDAAEGAIRPLFMKLTSRLSIIDSHEEYLYAITNHQFDNGKVIRFHPSKPMEWEEVVTGYEDAKLLEAQVFTDHIVCRFRQGTRFFICIYSLQGEIKQMIKFDEGYYVSGVIGEREDRELIYYYTSYFIPPIVNKVSLDDYKISLLQKTEVAFEHEKYKILFEEYPSKDGTMVPMTIVCQKDIKLDGKNPTLLKTYGGYGSIHRPRFDEGLVFFLSKGGVFAYAHVRGEGINGGEWAAAGKRLQKQNSIDDLISAAEYLTEKKYSSPKHLGISGGSHGGLLVGAAMTQRPDLFGVAVPIVGVFDMLRFEKFTDDPLNRNEFGTVSNEEDFKNLYAYSPLHRIQKGVNYPTTLIMTSDNDERVPPYQSYKFAAALQNNEGQKNPVILRVERKAGHSGAIDYSRGVFEGADFYSFLLYHLKEKK